MKMKYELTEKEKIAKDMVCLAVDLEDKEEILELIDELSDLVGYYKLNSAFTNHGPELVREIKKRGGKIFLDLKFHEIPNTCANYAKAATRLGVDMFNVHASGGLEMMKWTVKGAEEEAKKLGIKKPIIIAVTVLTSLDKDALNNELKINGEIDEQVYHLAKLSNIAGMDGIVCSSADLNAIKDKLPSDFLYVTPGVKGVTNLIGSDQKRVFSPANAVKAGSSMLVIGRAIYSAENRRKAAYEILQDMAKEL